MPRTNSPCDELSLAEVVARITEWSRGNIELNDVIDLIDPWADQLRYPLV